MKKIVFITGGARSGKSSFALKQASGIPGKKAYIATAEALDEEMRKRIEDHRKQRGKEWDTFEEPLMIAEVINKIGDRYERACSRLPHIVAVQYHALQTLVLRLKSNVLYQHSSLIRLPSS